MALTSLKVLSPDVVKEVDFYKNPTILSRMILNQKYTSATNRLQHHPEEASTWVSSKRNPYRGRALSLMPGKKITPLQRYSSSRHALPKLSIQSLEYSVRQLPIHVACANLLRCQDDPTLRTDLEILITKLVITNPGSCHAMDHEGRIPLHEALWHNARPETISIMLIAAPLTLHARDKYGRSPLDLNRLRSGDDSTKEQIKVQLLRGTYFWEQARAAALSKMEAAAARTQSQGPEQETKMSERKLADGGKVEAVTWIKLERRAIHLEQLLAGMYEKNYELGELVEELTQSKTELQKENETLRIHTPREMESISAANDELKMQVAKLEAALKEQENWEMDDNIMTHDADSFEFFEDRHANQQAELEELRERNREYQMEVERLELLVESYRQRLGDGFLATEMSSIPEDDEVDEQSLATQDLENLMDTIESMSHCATERYLARKVMDLDLRLKEVSATAESELAISREENARLVRENEVLAAEVIAQPRGLFPPPDYDGTPKTRGKGIARKQLKQLSRNSSTKSIASDDLQNIFVQAAEMYASSSSLPEVGALGATCKDSVGLATKKECSTSVQITGQSLDMPEILNEAKKIYGVPMPKPLDFALRKASLSALWDNVDEFVEKAADFFGSPIPREIQVALQKASSIGTDDVGAIPSPPTRTLSSSSSVSQLTLPQSLAVKSGVTDILEEAKRMYGHEIPENVADAFRAASMLTMSKKLSRSPSPSDIEPLDVEDLDVTMHELRKLCKDPLPPALTLALRKASLCSSSFLMDSDLELPIIQPIVPGKLKKADPIVGNRESADTKRSASDTIRGNEKDKTVVKTASNGSFESEVDDILGKAEQMYGNEIPPEFNSAFRTASLSTLSRKETQAPSPQEPQPFDLEDLEVTMREIRKFYTKPIPTQLTGALRQASVSSGITFISGISDDEDCTVHDPSVVEERQLEDEALSRVPEGSNYTQSSSSGRASMDEKISHKDEIFSESIDESQSTSTSQGASAAVYSDLPQQWRDTQPSSSSSIHIPREESQRSEGDDDSDDECSEGNDENDYDLDSILQEAEILNGKGLSPALITAWRKTSVSVYEQDDDDATVDTVDTTSTRVGTRSLIQPPRSLESEVRHGVRDVTDNLDIILSQAARMCSQPNIHSEECSLPPDEITTKDDARPKTPRRTASQSSALSGRTFSTVSTQSDCLDDLYAEAAPAFSSPN